MVELAIFIFLAVWHLPQAPKLIAIYDARLSPKPAKLFPADVAFRLEDPPVQIVAGAAVTDAGVTGKAFTIIFFFSVFVQPPASV